MNHRIGENQAQNEAVSKLEVHGDSESRGFDRLPEAEEAFRAAKNRLFSLEQKGRFLNNQALNHLDENWNEIEPEWDSAWGEQPEEFDEIAFANELREARKEIETAEAEVQRVATERAVWLLQQPPFGEWLVDRAMEDAIDAKFEFNDAKENMREE